MPWLRCWLRLIPAISPYDLPSSGNSAEIHRPACPAGLLFSFSLLAAEGCDVVHQSLGLPGLHPLQLLRETRGVGGGGKGLFAEDRGGLMLAVSVAGVPEKRRMITSGRKRRMFQTMSERTLSRATWL